MRREAANRNPHMPLKILYYNLKPLIPRSLQIFLRRRIVARKYKLYTHVWPIDPGAGKLPDGWAGWPNNKQFALVLTHDVEIMKGYKKCLQLMHLEQNLGFRSSFNFVPNRYDVSSEFRRCITSNGFEVGVHGLRHDEKLYLSKKVFQQRAIRINHYLKEWESVGFRSPSMHHNLTWLHELNIEYDASTFDNCPFEPQCDGVGTIFPFWVQGSNKQKGYAELPYTLPQDHGLFIIMKEESIKIWKEKLDWIADKGGMVLLNTHPDYMYLSGNKPKIDEYFVEHYIEFLEYVRHQYKGKYWHGVPCELIEIFR